MRHAARPSTGATQRISEWAIRWAKAARSVGPPAFAVTRALIDELHLQALVDSGMDVLPAYKDHLILMAEIDAL